MNVPLDEVIHFDGIVSTTTGAAADADSTPAWAIFEEDTDTAILSGNMTKRTSLTGHYRASATVSAANGFEVGKWYQIVGSATISSVAAKGRLDRFRVVAAESQAGFPKTDAQYIGGTSQTGRDIGGSLIILANTAQAGGASTITLNAGASATDNLYRDNWIVITGGTGAGQSREISGYVGSTKVATVSKAWITNPDNTSTFAIVPAAAVENVVNTNSLTAAILAAGDVWGVGIETSLKRITAFVAGVYSGLPNSPVTIKSPDGVTGVATVVFDTNYNRTSVTFL